MRYLSFNRNLLFTVIATCITSNAVAQNDAIEEIVVSGVRAAQERAIDIKRNSAQIVDSVSAEDIDRLPDVTIADSLQRITGIQIARTGGQGGAVSVRGMGQVMSTLNGEYFLTPANSTRGGDGEDRINFTNGVNFTDVPASLVSGLNVSKSQAAAQLEGGIGGSIDIITRRALSLDNGFSGSARIQAASGSITKETDPELSGLVGWNFDDKVAMSLAFSYGESTLAENRGRLRADRAAETWDCSSSCADLDGNGQLDGDFINPMSWNSPEFSSREIERERLGLAYNFNMIVSESLELNADIFYTGMDEKSAGQFIYLGNQIGGRGGFHEYTLVTGQPAMVKTGDGSLGGQPFYATEVNTMVSGFRGGVSGDYRESSALNTNIELRYDNGEMFTGSARWASGRGDTDNNNLTLAQVSNAQMVVREPGGSPVNINPGAIDDGLIYPMHVRVNSNNVYANISQDMAAKMSNPDAWYLHSGWVESIESNAEYDVLRFDGNFQLADEGLTSIDVGYRISNRESVHNNMSFFSPSGVVVDGVELLNKFHEVGYAVGQSGSEGTAKGLTYDPLPAVEITDPRLNGYIGNVSNFGNALKGFDVNIPMIDTRKINDPIAFNNMIYGKGMRLVNPDRSYKVVDGKQSIHFQANFDKAINDVWRVNGNAGMRYVRTDLTVTQNITDPTMLNPLILAGTDPNHTAYVDLGDQITDITYNHFLPSINLNIGITDDFKIKLAYDSRLALQDLNRLGEGSITYLSSEESYVDENGETQKENFQRVSSRQNNGNPYLKPWESDVFNIAAEWYPTETAILSIGYFHIDIASFTYDEVVQNPTLPDSDGVVRRGAEERTISNGAGGMVQGWEFSYQQSFDFLPSFLSNTGITFNYTYSPSKNPSIDVLPDGSQAPFNSTAEDQANLILWYQDDKFEARIAANYLGKQFQGLASGWMWTPPNEADGMPRFMKETLFVDLTAAYNINDKMQLTFAINNLTEEDNITYTQWSDFISDYNIFERRTTVGLNLRF